MTPRTQTASDPSSVAPVLDALGTTATSWTIDPAASRFELRGRYVFGPAITARFAIASGEVVISDDRSQITGSLLLDAASLDSGIGLRDDHMRDRRSALDVARHPTIRFDLDRAEPGRTSTFDIWGRATIREITSPIQLRVDARIEGEQVELTASGDLDHRPFKIEMPGLNRKIAVRALLLAVPNPSTRTSR